jgi:hypothetical protein
MIYLKEVENVSVWKKNHITKDIFLVQVHIMYASFIKFWKLLYYISLQAFMATEFNEIFSDRQLHQEFKFF